jgi:hypothetical protein
MFLTAAVEMRNIFEKLLPENPQEVEFGLQRVAQ